MSSSSRNGGRQTANAGNVRLGDPLYRSREKNTRCLISLLLFPTTRPSADTLPSRLDLWDRYKGLKREGRKDDLNIDSSLWNPEAIFSDVIRYPKMDIHRTVYAKVTCIMKRVTVK